MSLEKGYVFWLNKKAEKPPHGGSSHYFEKANSFFSQQKGKSTVAEFEKIFAEFESKYFEGLPRISQMMENMSCPQSTRMLWVLTNFTK